MIWQGAGTKESVLIEIFASRTNEQIRALNEVYLQGEVTGRLLSRGKVKSAKIVCRVAAKLREILKLTVLTVACEQSERRSWALTWRRKFPETFPMRCSSWLRLVFPVKPTTSHSGYGGHFDLFGYVRMYIFSSSLGQEGGEHHGGHAEGQRRRQGDVWRTFGFLDLQELSHFIEWILTFCLLFVGSGPSLL